MIFDFCRFSPRNWFPFITLPEPNKSHLKIDGCNTSLSFWVQKAYFQGRLLNSSWKNSMEKSIGAFSLKVHVCWINNPAPQLFFDEFASTHRIHVWYICIYLNLVDFCSKCMLPYMDPMCILGGGFKDFLYLA